MDAMMEHRPECGFRRGGTCICDLAGTMSPKSASVPFRPFNAGVLVRRHEAAAESAGGIVIPETAKDPPKSGTVVAFGPACVNGLREGMTVFFRDLTGIEIEIAGVRYLWMEECDLLGEAS